MKAFIVIYLIFLSKKMYYICNGKTITINTTNIILDNMLEENSDIINIIYNDNNSTSKFIEIDICIFNKYVMSYHTDAFTGELKVYNMLPRYECRNRSISTLYSHVMKDYISDFLDDIKNFNIESYAMIIDKIRMTYPIFLNMIEEYQNMIYTNNNKSVPKSAN